jgi:hypothetical protein
MGSVEEEIFRAIEFKSVLPLFTALSVGFIAAIVILIGEVLLNDVLNKWRCLLGIKK